ncbi:SLIT-ROBO Rho GTPase-activating protein 2-like [Limulus polyphemus]|uniref:SLIT-ROBO Rho GTPase-activating protein 2-like n=1 Tax=Limulus polyphemus TaxID=6850 RepID=A0ABM1RY50_LIMPO|nr:SLIT-ROBO Rho GTPase-activating protein 2-like [Limulus polyphemus]
MMDPYNLATCFGPSFLPIPEDKNQVQYQNLFNELIKKIIIYQEEIFPDDGGIAYEKYISHIVPEEIDMEESSLDNCPDSLDAISSSEVETPPSEDEHEVFEGVAQTSFCGQTEHELSFNKGDTLQLYSQVCNKWWRGSLNGREGLIPDKCIFLRLNIMEDKGQLSQDGSKGHQASSSSDSLSGSSSSPKPKKEITGPDTFLPASLATLSSSSVSSSGISSLLSLNSRRRLSLSPSTLRKIQLPLSGEFQQPKLVHSCSVGESMEDRL